MYDFMPSVRIAHRWSVIACEPPQGVLVDVGDQFRAAGANDFRRACPLAKAEAEAIVDPSRFLQLGRIGVGDGHAVDRAVRLGHVHGAPIGEAGDGHPGDPPQRALVIDQRRQGRAGLGEKFDRLLGALSRGGVADNADKHLPPVRLKLAHGQVHGKGRSVLPPPRHFPAHADDVRLARVEVAGDVLVVAAVVGLGHEHVDISPDRLGGRVAENPLCRRIEGLDAARPSIVMIPSTTFSSTARRRPSASANSSSRSAAGCDRELSSPSAHRLRLV